MIKNIGIGFEKGKYYVQTCCGEEHIGQKCDCKTLIEDVPEKMALKISKKNSKKLNVPIDKWY